MDVTFTFRPNMINGDSMSLRSSLRWFIVLVSLLLTVSEVKQVRAQQENYHTIEVIDSATGRGVPLVQVSVGDTSFVTDSNGYIALDEPSLINQTMSFDFASYGYASISESLNTLLGNESQIQIVRNNRAERLYRATGAGIYSESVKLGQNVLINKPISNANILGQDSVQAVVFKNQAWWFWGDTLYENGGGIGGNYFTAGAISQLPGQGGLAPGDGIDYTYFEDAQGQSRPMFPQYQSTGKPVWVDGLFTVKDNQGQEKLLAHFVNVESLFPQFVLLEQGLAVFNEAAGRFVKSQDYGVAPQQVWGTGPPIVPAGHSFRHSTGGEDYIYFGENYPNIRVKDNWNAVNDITQWEAYTPLQANSRYNANNPPLELDDNGKPIYGWKLNTDPLGTEIFEEMVSSGHLSRTEAPVGLVDLDTGANVKLHRSTVNWNEYRNKWVMIGNESGGDGSFLGEVWYAEAPTPEGPWKKAVKIITHGDPTGELGGSYSFYNPAHLPFLDEADGRFIHLHGTYSTNFFDSAPTTPGYEYNQIAYRLDLSTIPQLAANLLPADFNADALVDPFDLVRWQDSYGANDQGDANDDGQSDGADFLLWQQQFGQTPAPFPNPSILVVPEPSSTTLLVLMLSWAPGKRDR